MDLLTAPVPVRSGDTVTHEKGIAFTSDDWARLRRFLILGSEGGTFYVKGRELTKQNADVVRRCLDADYMSALQQIYEVSDKGLAHKNEPAIFALALAASHQNQNVRAGAFSIMPKVCRTGTHLLHFVAYCKQLRKSSRMYRTQIGNWFDRPDLAYQAVKYQSRDGWSLADVLKLARPTPKNEEQDWIFNWIVTGKMSLEHTPALIREAADLRLFPDLAAEKIREHRIPREAVPTELLNKPEVWEALLESMPMTAMIRNLGKMTAVGLLEKGSEAEREIVARLFDVERLRKARIHPLSVLMALKVYEQGHGDKGKLSWSPVKGIVNALDETFYLTFPNVPSTGKKIRLALDVSSSMDGSKVSGTALSAREASAAMALVTREREPNAHFVAYSHELVLLEIRPSMRLDAVIRDMRNIPFGGTHCALPVIHAIADKTDIDAFVSYTDSETMDGAPYWSGLRGTYTDHLNVYRDRINPQARSVVVGLTSNGFTLNDPQDPLGMDVVGFDASAPAVIGDFIGGKI